MLCFLMRVSSQIGFHLLFHYSSVYLSIQSEYIVNICLDRCLPIVYCRMYFIDAYAFLRQLNMIDSFHCCSSSALTVCVSLAWIYEGIFWLMLKRMWHRAQRVAGAFLLFGQNYFHIVHISCGRNTHVPKVFQSAVITYMWPQLMGINSQAHSEQPVEEGAVVSSVRSQRHLSEGGLVCAPCSQDVWRVYCGLSWCFKFPSF